MLTLSFLPLTVVLACVGHADGQSTRPARPRALVMAERAREALRTGALVWTRTSPRGVRHYTSRFAGARITCQNRGDDRGVVAAAADGSVGPDGMRVRATLRMGDQLWVYAAGALRAEIYDPHGVAGCPNPRTLGMLTSIGDRDLDDLLWRDSSQQPSPRIYEETKRADGLHVVTAKAESWLRTWVIDESRGWNPVRVTCADSNGKVLSDVRSTLARVDGIWFPEIVVQYSSDPANGGQPVDTIHVEAASFNRPDHPQTFGPADIGIEPGVQIMVYGAGIAIKDIKQGGMHWDGERLINTEEYLRRTADGSLDERPNVRRELARLSRPVDTSSASFRRVFRPGPPPNPPAASGPAAASPGLSGLPPGPRSPEASFAVESEWEKYTREFISEHHLTEPQARAAKGVLADCVARLRTSLNSAAHGPGSGTATAASTQQAAPSEPGRRSSVAARITERIFEEQLKPRLRELLTDAQRADEKR